MERFILTEKEQQVFKLCSYLLNKEQGVVSIEKIIKEIGFSKNAINYAVLKLRRILEQVLGKENFLLSKKNESVYLQLKQSFSFQMLKNAYVADSFFLHFFQEVYHERFCGLMKETEEKFISYETGKKELLKCKKYLQHFSLSLCTKKRVGNMVCGDEKQVRFMYFCMVLSQFQGNSEHFFEIENKPLDNFLDDIVAEFPYIFLSSQLKLRIFYRICLDRIKKGHLLADEMTFPSYFESPDLSLALFSQKVDKLFSGMTLTEQQKKTEVEFLYFLFCTLIFQPLDNLKCLGWQARADCQVFQLFYQTIEKVGKTTLAADEKRFICYAIKQCLVWHQMFQVSFCFNHLMIEEERFAEENKAYDLLWQQVKDDLQKAAVYQELFAENPNMVLFLKRIFNSLAFLREVPCHIFLLCYSAITQSIVMENLKNRKLTVTIDFVQSIQEADIVISELELPHGPSRPKFVCFVNSPFDRRDWQNIDDAILAWRSSQLK